MSRPGSALAVALTALVLAACGSSNKSSAAKTPATTTTPAMSSTATVTSGSSAYTAAARRDFVASCERNAPASGCECMFAYLKAHVPFYKLTGAGANPRNPYIQQALRACLPKK